MRETSCVVRLLDRGVKYLICLVVQKLSNKPVDPCRFSSVFRFGLHIVSFIKPCPGHVPKSKPCPGLVFSRIINAFVGREVMNILTNKY